MAKGAKGHVHGENVCADKFLKGGQRLDYSGKPVRPYHLAGSSSSCGRDSADVEVERAKYEVRVPGEVDNALGQAAMEEKSRRF